MAIFVSGLGAIERQNTTTDAFRRWFGKSVVRNPDGSPKVLYHGTTAPEGVDLTEDFRFLKPSRYGNLGPGIYLTDSAKAASDFSLGVRGEESQITIRHSRVFPLYVRMEKPIPDQVSPAWLAWIGQQIERSYAGSEARWLFRDLERDGVDVAHGAPLPKKYADAVRESSQYAERMRMAVFLAKIKAGNFRTSEFFHPWKDSNNIWQSPDVSATNVIEGMIARGFDGVILKRNYGTDAKFNFTEYVVPSSTQVKSVFNRGNWDPNDSDILNGIRVFSRR